MTFDEQMEKIAAVLQPEMAATLDEPDGAIIALLRAASQLLLERGGEMAFPVWDVTTLPPEQLAYEERIRDAAFCILGGVADDVEMSPSENVAALVRYVADLLED